MSVNRNNTIDKSEDDSLNPDNLTMNPDKAINKSEDDLLNRNSFSEHLAKALLNSKEEKEENLVIALCGKWGSGKSSIINLTKEHIKNNKDVKNKPIIIDFNPWYFSGLNNLIHYFFDEIAEKLGSLKTDKQLRKIAKNLKRYEVILSNKPVIDLIKDILYIFSTILSFCGIKFTECSWRWLWSGSGAFVTLSLILFAIAFYRSVKSYRLQQHSLIKSSIDDLKEKISNDLKKINNKLIIVIDDIDRLTKTEIRQLFQLIKINADFPNVIYLLAFDREIVENNLTVQDGFSGKDYLEKIVQVFFDIPYVTPAKIHELLYK
jgi:predicted KAP-like P-loop ATPase